MPKPESTQVNIQFTSEELSELDAAVEERQAKEPGVRLGRAALVRDIVLKSIRRGGRDAHA
jgi:hypothetical protein